MIPLRSDVNTLVRSLLGDTAVAAGSIYTATFIPPFLNLSYQELFNELFQSGAQRVQRVGYYLLPAYTSVFVPSTGGISNMGGLLSVRERGGATAYAVSGAVPASPSAGICRITLSAPLPAEVVTGAQVDLYSVAGLSDDVNDSWVATINSTTQVDLNGCAATGTFSGSSGRLIHSTEEWSWPLEPVADPRQFPTISVQTKLAWFCYQRGFIRFPKCSVAREIAMTYELSSSLPISGAADGDSMGIDDCLMFLATRTAAWCAGSKGNRTAQNSLLGDASRALDNLLNQATRQLQVSEPIVPPPFRFKRNGPYIF